jgi:hypothetical protein
VNQVGFALVYRNTKSRKKCGCQERNYRKRQHANTSGSYLFYEFYHILTDASTIDAFMRDFVK